jgi:thiamine pyrophosphokinase
VLLLGNEDFAGANLRIVDGDTTAYVVRRSVSLSGSPRDFVTLLPLSDEARGVTTDGLEYAVDDATLQRADSLGVSNELVGSDATVSVGDGVLLVVHQPRPSGQ